MTTEEPIKEIVADSTVTLHFSLSLTDGTEALNTFDEEPMTLTMGDGTFQPGMEMALYGLKPGDEQTLTLSPEQGFGYPDESLVHDIPLDDFGTETLPETGQIIAFSLPNGEETSGTILEVHEDRVNVDFNHPLAGHEVVFKVKVLDID